MSSSWMLCRVALVRTDVSEERVASIIRVTRIAKVETTFAVTSNRRTLRMMEALDSYKTLVLTRATRRDLVLYHMSSRVTALL
jgi:hypothetical protein